MEDTAFSGAELSKSIVLLTRERKLPWTVRLDEQKVPGSETTAGAMNAKAKLSIEGREYTLVLMGRDMTPLREQVQIKVKGASPGMEGAAQEAAERLQQLLTGKEATLIVLSADKTWQRIVRGKEAEAVATEVYEYAKAVAFEHEDVFNGWVQRVLHGPKD
jgi:hypothetical protein